MITLKVGREGKGVGELLQELSPNEFSGLVNYYKDDFAISYLQ